MKEEVGSYFNGAKLMELEMGLIICVLVNGKAEIKFLELFDEFDEW